MHTSYSQSITDWVSKHYPSQPEAWFPKRVFNFGVRSAVHLVNSPFALAEKAFLNVERMGVFQTLNAERREELDAKIASATRAVWGIPTPPKRVEPEKTKWEKLSGEINNFFRKSSEMAYEHPYAIGGIVGLCIVGLLIQNYYFHCFSLNDKECRDKAFAWSGYYGETTQGKYYECLGLKYESKTLLNPRVLQEKSVYCYDQFGMNIGADSVEMTNWRYYSLNFMAVTNFITALLVAIALSNQ